MKTAKVLIVYPLVSREYTDRENNQRIFKSKGIILHDGQSSIYGEAIQDMAEQIDQMNLQVGEMVSVHLLCKAREYTDNNGTRRVTNEITLTHLMRWT